MSGLTSEPGDSRVQSARQPLTRELIEEYRIIVDEVGSISTGRQALNNVYAAINVVFLSGLGLLLSSSHLTSWAAVISTAALSLAVLPLNLTWRRILSNYRRVLTVHYEALEDFERRYDFAANLQTKIAVALYGKGYGSQRRASVAELRLATYFIALYPAITAVAALATYLTIAGLIPTF